MKTWHWILISVAAIGGGGFLIWWFLLRKPTTKKTTTTTQPAQGATGGDTSTTGRFTVKANGIVYLGDAVVGIDNGDGANYIAANGRLVNFQSEQEVGDSDMTAAEAAAKISTLI